MRYYDASMLGKAEKQRYIISHLDQALAEGWTQVYYQPIVRAVNSRVCDEEALTRWIDPVRGFLSPGDFIPILEDAGLLYKLDLFVVDQIIEKLRRQAEAGLHLVPQSVNLSRSDFDACDMIEEICRRVDEAGLDHGLLTIEITESVIGNDFAFIKAQIGRFRSLGFPVWMDEFGSGYSSLDVLQSVKFDLIKFDMGFMQKLDEGESGKIILFFSSEHSFVLYTPVNLRKVIVSLFGIVVDMLLVCSLKETAALLSAQFGLAHCYRFGGDEFLVIYPEITPEDFERKLEAALHKLPSVRIEGKTESAGFSAGFTTAVVSESYTLREMFSAADEKMYEDKWRKQK